MTEAKLSGIRAVVFDAVGTLIQPRPPAHEIYAAVGQRHGSRHHSGTIRRRFVAAFARQEQIDRAHDWQTSEARERRRWRDIVHEVLDDAGNPEACFEELFAHFGRAQAWSCAAGTGPVLRELCARGYVLALASNYDSRLHAVAAQIADLQPLRRRIYISSELGWRKPSPRFFAAVAAHLSVKPEQLLHVGDDRENDFEGARSAGLHALLLDPAATGAGADAVAGLPGLLDRLGGSDGPAQSGH